MSLQDLISSSEGIQSKDHPELLRVALSLALNLESLEAEISRLKPLVRDRARDQVGDSRPGRVVFPLPPEGEVTVTFQRDRVSLDKDFPVQTLKEALGEVFFELFEEKTSYTPKKEILSLVENLPEHLRKILLESVRVSEETPRVGFSFKS